MTRIKMIHDLQDGIPVQWVGVYALNWRMEWGLPSVGFVEEDDPKDILIAELLEALKAVIEHGSVAGGIIKDGKYIIVDNIVRAAIAKAEGGKE